MKLRLTISLLFVASVSTSCSGTSGFDWSKYKNNDVAMTLRSNKYANYNADFDTESFENACNQLVTCAEEGDIQRYQTNVTYVNKNIYTLYSCLDICETRFYENKEDTESKEKYKKYLSLSRLYSEKHYESSEIIYKSGNREFIKYYFGEMTDEEIEAYLEANKYDEKMSNWEKEITDIQDAISEASNDYEQKTITLEEFNNVYYDNYFKLITTGNELAKYKGYSNYLEYLYYSSYGRDYSYSDSLIYAKYVKEYILPFYSSTSEKVLDDPSFRTYLNNINFCNNYFDFSIYFNELAHYMGSDYENYYNNMWGNGFYCFSGNDNSIGTAYTVWLPHEDEYLLFFSKNYQGILTVCHEFGHAYALSTNYRNSWYCLDIKETHSTTNEYLYMVYTYKNMWDINVHYYDFAYSMLNNVRSDCFGLCGPAIASEIEYSVYTDPNLTKDSMIKYIEDIQFTYPSINPVYIAYSTAVNPGYYISYGTSSVATLQFFLMFMKNFDEGANSFKKFIAYQGEQIDVLSIWRSVGINSPFEKQTYIDLVNGLSNYIK